MTRLARFVTGRRTKWAVLGIWILVALVTLPIGQKVSDVIDNRVESFLPESAETKEVVELQNTRFASGQTTTGLIIYERPGGLTPADRAKIASDARRASQELPLTSDPAVPFGPRAPVGSLAGDGSLATTTVTVPLDIDKLADWGADLREITGEGSGGLSVYVSGDLGFQTDSDEVFNSLDAKLLLATVALVLVLLGLIYRAPLAAITPLIVLLFAYFVSQALVYAYGKAGNSVNDNGQLILVVLMFGVGTDYCLLLMSRYREELRAHEDKHEAMELAFRRVAPAILASGLTVALALLVLLVADTGFVKTLGPVAAIGVTAAFVAGLTLLPALLTMFGRAAFWPRRSAVAYDPQHRHAESAGVWVRVGSAVLRRPGLALGGTLLLFGCGALGLFAYEVNYSTTNAFTKETESVEGFKALEEKFPAGALQPTTILVERADGPVTLNDLETVAREVADAPGVASVSSRPTNRSEDGRMATFDLTLAEDPYTVAAIDRIPEIRDRLADAGPGLRALAGGGSATQYDFDASARSDIKLIVPLTLLVIAVILGILLNAIVAPIVLIGTVLASFFGTLGLSMLFIRYVLDDAGVDPSLLTFAFIFLVALGTDYTIFLMSRVREEARIHGTREGTLRALGATGGVITSAGIILAGTFSVLMTLPVTFILHLGFIVAVGILLDTFLVRTVMVPAAIELIGDRIWWPSTAEGGGHVLRERTGPESGAQPAGL
jgi:RND superfamily putative drug exporter